MTDEQEAEILRLRNKVYRLQDLAKELLVELEAVQYGGPGWARVKELRDRLEAE